MRKLISSTLALSLFAVAASAQAQDAGGTPEAADETGQTTDAPADTTGQDTTGETAGPPAPAATDAPAEPDEDKDKSKEDESATTEQGAEAPPADTTSGSDPR